MPALRMTISGDAVAELVSRAESLGIDPADMISAIAESHAGDKSVDEVLHGRSTLQGSTPDDFHQALSPLTDLAVAAVRLSAPSTEGQQSSPFARSILGASMGELDLETLWGSVRGHWVISPKTDVLVGFRLGNPLGVFRVDEWSPPASDKRRYALDGYAIRGARRFRFTLGGASDIGPASDEEIAMADTIMSRRLVMKRGASNPIVRLRLTD